MLRSVDLRRAQIGTEQLRTAKDIKWKEAIVVIVAVKEAAFLVPVHLIVCRIKVEDDLLRGHRMRLDELIHQKGIHLDGRLSLRMVLKTTQGWRTRQWLIATHCRLQGDVMAEFIVIVEILFAASDGIDPLP